METLLVVSIAANAMLVTLIILIRHENGSLTESLERSRRYELDWKNAYTAECQAHWQADEDRKEADETIERNQLATLPSLTRESGEWHEPRKVFFNLKDDRESD